MTIPFLTYREAAAMRDAGGAGLPMQRFAWRAALAYAAAGEPVPDAGKVLHSAYQKLRDPLAATEREAMKYFMAKCGTITRPGFRWRDWEVRLAATIEAYEALVARDADHPEVPEYIRDNFRKARALLERDSRSSMGVAEREWAGEEAYERAKKTLWVWLFNHTVVDGNPPPKVA